MKTLLFRPFEKYSEKILLLVGFLFTLGGSFAAYAFNTRFDGVFDFHIVSKTLLYQALVDNLINVLCLILFLYVSAKYINRKTRLIDVLSTSMVARIPLYLLPFSNINGVLNRATEDIIRFPDLELISQISFSSRLIIIVFGIITVFFLIWYLYLLFNGFKVASNGKGTISIILFIISLLFAEILSKILIFQLN